jgi:hypothetical protein
LLRTAYKGLEKLQQYVWERFKPRLDTPFERGRLRRSGSWLRRRY